MSFQKSWCLFEEGSDSQTAFQVKAKSQQPNLTFEDITYSEKTSFENITYSGEKNLNCSTTNEKTIKIDSILFSKPKIFPVSKTNKNVERNFNCFQECIL
jgi:hypothetical protein